MLNKQVLVVDCGYVKYKGVVISETDNFVEVETGTFLKESRFENKCNIQVIYERQ